MRAILFVFAVLAIVLGVVDAREDRVARLKRKLLARQAPFNGPTTVTTTRTAQTFAGTVVETCIITLTPIIVNGQSLVKEERNCSTQLVSSSSSLPASSTSTAVVTKTASPSLPGNVARPISTSTLVVTVTAAEPSLVTVSPVSTTSAASTPAVSTTSSAVTTSETGSSSSSVSSSSSSPAPSSSSLASTSTATSSVAVATSAVTSSVVATSTSQVVTSSAATSSAAQATSSSAPAGGPAKEIGTQTVSASSLPSPSTTVPASSTSPLAVSATPAQAEASPSTTEFTLPGKKLEVLPIGLGVFAGISVIALIVVGLVTYERTKYRKAFRQRKLAEQGAGMGYNGMSERV
ncbi:hypothetical protein ACGC1H_006910 [Rhizoctonia solani]|uniref:Mid2 domain-containing protein n=1 Tax=Rhizoctonia solani TaxID=456999 RepID=A0A8H2Y2A4_9AGAM|nr:unnamed protein product [Rhizoctonia solani]